MRGLPFAAYDFFAYVIPGALCVFCWDFVFDHDRLMNGITTSGGSAWLGIAVILISYLVGQVIAGPANVLTSLFHEMTLRRRPVETEMRPWWDSGLKPLPNAVRAKLWEHARDDVGLDSGEKNAFNTLYYLALSNYLSAATASSEIGGYLNVAAFCQYTSVASAICVVMVLLGSRLGTPINWMLLIGFALASVFLYFRFGRSQYRYIVRMYLLYMRSVSDGTS